MIKSPYVALAAMLAALAACDSAPIDAAGDDAAPAIHVSEARIRTPLGGRDVTAGYLTIANAGGPDRLLEIRADIAESVELHATEIERDLARMVHIDVLEVAGGETVRFEPSGRHLMLFGVPGDLAPGDSAALTLVFERAGELTVGAVIVDDPSAERDARAGHR